MTQQSMHVKAQTKREFRILPVGEFMPQDDRKMERPWRLTRERGLQLVALAKQRKIDYLIDYEHQSIQETKTGPIPAAGWFKTLAMKEDGLYVVDARWTQQAKQMISSEEYRFISPVFNFNPHTGDVTNIHSIALTNDPALHGLTDLKYVAVNSAKMVQQESQFTEKDRANFQWVFGDTPEALHAKLNKPEPKAPAGVTEEDWHKLRHVFGDSIDGQS